MERVVIQFSRLRLMNDLPRLVEALQDNEDVGEIGVPNYLIRCKPQGLPRDLQCFLILPLFAVDKAQIAICLGFPWVALNTLLIYLDRFIQFPRYNPIIVGCDR